MVLVELGELKPDMTINIKCDYKRTVDLTKNSTHHSRTKHIDVHHHFVGEAVKNGQVSVLHESTEFVVADVLTKALSRVKHRW
ncbi:unnamed protein product [Nezara viridula]|uniref:Uncharacterized protein n=1 Tax=Nezara viridula TaxID=85310 RepID=A0A9P0GZX3_NEZVI|nr:unnamed protein product [Nezara viridula]